MTDREPLRGLPVVSGSFAQPLKSAAPGPMTFTGPGDGPEKVP